MKNFANNRLLWTLIGVVLVAMLGVGAVTSQMSSAAPAQPAAKPAAVASGEPGAQTQASQAQPAASAPAKPFLSDYQDPQAQPAPNSIGTILSLILKLGVVIGLIYLTVLGLRYFSNRGRNTLLGGTNAINVIERTALSQNRELYLIDVADKVLLLGATTSAISILTEITDPTAIEDLRTKPQPSLPSAEPFLSYLKNVGEKVGTEVANVTPLRPTDVLKRIESHRERIRERTAALQTNDALGHNA